MKPSSAWRAQTPPAGFSDRATAAILADRATRRPPLVGRRWVVLAIAATLLVAGAAWGWRAQPRVPTPEPSQASFRAPRQDLEGAIASPHLLPPLLQQRAPQLPAPLVTPRPPRVVAVPAPSAPPPKLILPPCSCNEFACDCGPE